jgi:mRNA interferase RelE/StbE
MTSFIVAWRQEALDAAATFMDDFPGVLATFAATDALADEPRPPHSHAYGTPDRRRLKVGRYRVMYEVDPQAGTIVVMHLGRVGPEGRSRS